MFQQLDLRTAAAGLSLHVDELTRVADPDVSQTPANLKELLRRLMYLVVPRPPHQERCGQLPQRQLKTLESLQLSHFLNESLEEILRNFRDQSDR